MWTGQWQAQDGAQPPEAAGALDSADPELALEASDVAGAAASEAVAAEAGAPVAPPPLKSVAYQPVPLS